MPGEGPEFPLHLAKRKRSSDDSGDTFSPRCKFRTASPPTNQQSLTTTGPNMPPLRTVGTNKSGLSNPDEVTLESDSEDEHGSSVPNTVAPQTRVVGPTLPNPDELPFEEEPEDSNASPQQNLPPFKPRILGPVAPPASLSEGPSHAATAQDLSSDSDSDDYGPVLPSTHESLEATLHAEKTLRFKSLAEATPVKPQRAEWMLAPPTSDHWTSRINPSKLQNRKFASGKGARAPADKSGISAIWTETPEQKRQRLEDEVLGRTDGGSSASKSKLSETAKYSREKREAEAMEKRIREYNEHNRNRSLMEERQAAQAKGELVKEEEDDPSKRGFDREKDMALGGHMGSVKKREILGRAANFGTRFHRGSYL